MLIDSALVVIVNMKVVDMDVSFLVALVLLRYHF